MSYVKPTLSLGNLILHLLVHTELGFPLAQNTVGVQVKAIGKSYPHQPYADGGRKERFRKG